MDRITALSSRLDVLHSGTIDTPLFNPVFQLSLEISRLIEGGRMTLDEIELMVCELEHRGLVSRARRLQRLNGSADPPKFEQLIEHRLGDDFSDARARWEKPIELVCARRDRKSTRLNSSHVSESRMPSSA